MTTSLECLDTGKLRRVEIDNGVEVRRGTPRLYRERYFGIGVRTDHMHENLLTIRNDGGLYVSFSVTDEELREWALAAILHLDHKRVDRA